MLASYIALSCFLSARFRSFYSEDSSLIHGPLNKPGDVTGPAYGQININDKIMSLGFKDCHAKIRQVDSLETVGKGVVVQVTGELSNNGQPLRRFFQTFVLSPRSPTNYYVRNDIFRYQVRAAFAQDRGLKSLETLLTTRVCTQDEIFDDEELLDSAEKADIVADHVPANTTPSKQLNETQPALVIENTPANASTAVRNPSATPIVNGNHVEGEKYGQRSASETDGSAVSKTSQQPLAPQSTQAATTATAAPAEIENSSTAKGSAPSGDSLTVAVSPVPPSGPQTYASRAAAAAAKVPLSSTLSPGAIKLEASAAPTVTSNSLAPSPLVPHDVPCEVTSNTPLIADKPQAAMQQAPQQQAAQTVNAKEQRQPLLRGPRPPQKGQRDSTGAARESPARSNTIDTDEATHAGDEITAANNNNNNNNKVNAAVSKDPNFRPQANAYPDEQQVRIEFGLSNFIVCVSPILTCLCLACAHCAGFCGQSAVGHHRGAAGHLVLEVRPNTRRAH